MNIKDSLLDIFNKCGFQLSPEDYNQNIEMDSIQFMSIILSIEETYHLEVDQEYLSMDKLNTFNEFISMIEEKVLL